MNTRRPDLPAVLEPRKLWFPDPMKADAEGLVALGGDMSVPRLLLAYRSGIFPWHASPVTWWSPDPRGIIELDELHISHSLARVLHGNQFTYTINKAFHSVMEGCAEPAKGRETTWITSEFTQAYALLHEQGHAYSVECWQASDLVGGVYGVAVGGFFAGESMFHRASNASKAALCRLVQHLKERNFKLFDIQMLTPVTKSMGGKYIRRAEYLKRLKKAIAAQVTFV